MIEGFYRMTFTGASGSGFGIIVFQDGKVAGADVAGATFDGSYITNQISGGINFKVVMNAPIGVAPVQTGIPISAPISVEINGSLATSDIEKSNPILIQTEIGPINALFQKIRDS